MWNRNISQAWGEVLQEARTVGHTIRVSLPPTHRFIMDLNKYIIHDDM